jgi:hypothetical protein
LIIRTVPKRCSGCNVTSLQWVVDRNGGAEGAYGGRISSVNRRDTNGSWLPPYPNTLTNAVVLSNMSSRDMSLEDVWSSCR